MKRRRRGNGASKSSRWRLDIVALVPRHCRWRLVVVALVHRHSRIGVSELATLSRWRIGVVVLVHVGIAALRLGIAALAQCHVFVKRLYKNENTHVHFWPHSHSVKGQP
jgi:hypothetical protein